MLITRVRRGGEYQVDTSCTQMLIKPHYLAFSQITRDCGPQLDWEHLVSSQYSDKITCRHSPNVATLQVMIVMPLLMTRLQAVTVSCNDAGLIV